MNKDCLGLIAGMMITLLSFGTVSAGYVGNLTISNQGKFVSISQEALVVATVLKEATITTIEPKKQSFNENISRLEAGVFFKRMLGVLNETRDVSLSGFNDGLSCSFSDTTAPEITEICFKGLMRGYPDGRFGIQDKITRGQLVLVLARMLDKETKEITTDTAYDFMLKNEYLKRDDRKTGNMGDFIKREELLVVLYRIYKQDKINKSAQELLKKDNGEKIMPASMFSSNENKEQEEYPEVNQELLQEIFDNIKSL